MANSASNSPSHAVRLHPLWFTNPTEAVHSDHFLWFKSTASGEIFVTHSKPQSDVATTHTFSWRKKASMITAMAAIMPPVADIMMKASDTAWIVEEYIFHLPQWGLQYPTDSSR